jgi:hypothetical protein
MIIYKFPTQFHKQKSYQKNLIKMFWENSLDLKTINQGGVTCEDIMITFFIRLAKLKLFNRYRKQKMELLNFGKN